MYNGLLKAIFNKLKPLEGAIENERRGKR